MQFIDYLLVFQQHMGNLSHSSYQLDKKHGNRQLAVLVLVHYYDLFLYCHFKTYNNIVCKQTICPGGYGAILAKVRMLEEVI